MRQNDPQSIAVDEISNFDADSDSPAERVVATLLAWAVRLWCLPFLLAAWIVTWSLVLSIRGIGALANLGRGPLLRWQRGSVVH